MPSFHKCIGRLWKVLVDQLFRKVQQYLAHNQKKRHAITVFKVLWPPCGQIVKKHPVVILQFKAEILGKPRLAVACIFIMKYKVRKKFVWEFLLLFQQGILAINHKHLDWLFTSPEKGKSKFFIVFTHKKASKITSAELKKPICVGSAMVWSCVFLTKRTKPRQGNFYAHTNLH